jgi:NADH-ubiquinone oxidoreductase chain 1
VAQIISYEVCLVLFLLVAVYASKTYRLPTIKIIQDNIWVGLFCLPLFLVWMLLCIAEANRTPFDLAEGESEIVSGFNIEYGGGLFAFIFIREYGMIMFLRFITSLFFLGGQNILAKTFLVCFLFVWVRCAFPRVRYDVLIITA